MARLAVAVLLLAAGVVLGVYGLLLLVYQGRSGSGDTYITLSGNRVDAQQAGAIILPLALVVVAYAFWLLRRNSGRARRPS